MERWPSTRRLGSNAGTEGIEAGRLRARKLVTSWSVRLNATKTRVLARFFDLGKCGGAVYGGLWGMWGRLGNLGGVP